eukprot:TRINITY_DN94526_c0_g1_i1.p1 TRINITY_DN94526_c0_g1~~TRINITY_DN94526_c0_g1_i1.p1  ORF type:complete len:521 (+),score=81.40 TRINITY_DN94526_c0_g1_i1:183-1745(+)
MSYGRDRSRSPGRGVDTGLISRTIACFGRYPSKRPPGLVVEENGTMRLEDLMEHWGEREGLKERDILHSVRKHMFREYDGGGSLRFAMDSGADGGIVIRVMDKDMARPSRPPRRDHSSERSYMTPRSGYSTPRGGRQLMRALGTRLPEHQSRLRGSVAKQLSLENETLPKLSSSEKLDMSLDDLITKEVIDLEDDDASLQGSQVERAHRVRRAFGQMGLTPETMHTRLGPRDREGDGEGRNGKGGYGRGGGYRRNGEGRGRRQHDPAERVHRWISWVLRAGYKELGLSLFDSCWVDMRALVAVMATHRKDLGQMDADKLRCFIEETDVDGRFEINSEGRLRKLEKGKRVPRVQRSPFDRSAGFRPAAPSATADRERHLPVEVPSSPSSTRSPRRRSRSPSAESLLPDDDLLKNNAEDDVLARLCNNMRVSGDVEELCSVKAEHIHAGGSLMSNGVNGSSPSNGFNGSSSQQDVRPKPPPPPADGWEQFQDADGGSFWWYYNGPEGEWWTSGEGEVPQPYA